MAHPESDSLVLKRLLGIETLEQQVAQLRKELDETRKQVEELASRDPQQELIKSLRASAPR